MIDLHCHLLPGIGDGPETLDQAIALAGEMESWKPVSEMPLSMLGNSARVAVVA